MNEHQSSVISDKKLKASKRGLRNLTKPQKIYGR